MSSVDLQENTNLSGNTSTLIRFSNWFLPSKDELTAMYTNLHAEGVGNFTETYYWSSSESSATEAWAYHFDLDVAEEHAKNISTNAVRVCHTFVAGEGSYSLRDIGPVGGLIFYIKDGTIYYEAAPSDQSTGKIWSNVDDTEIGATAQGTIIGTGLTNSTAIIAQLGYTTGAPDFATDMHEIGIVVSLITAIEFS